LTKTNNPKKALDSREQEERIIGNTAKTQSKALVKKEDIGLLAAGGGVPRRWYKMNRGLYPAPRTKGRGIRATFFPVWLDEIMTRYGKKRTK
jgi:hypothetical protein